MADQFLANLKGPQGKSVTNVALTGSQELEFTFVDRGVTSKQTTGVLPLDWKGTLPSATNVDTVTTPGRYGLFAASPGGPGFSGELRVAELAAGGSVTTMQIVTQSLPGARIATRHRTLVTDWSAWADATTQFGDAFTSGAVNDLAPGVYVVPDASTVTGLPVATGSGTLSRLGDRDEYVVHGDAEVTYSRARTPGGIMSLWRQSRVERVTALSLSRPLGVRTESYTARSVRIPFQVPVRVKKWRVVFRNANYRSNVSEPGQVTLRSLVIGTPGHDENGAITRAFTPSAEFPQGLQILQRDLVANFGEEYATAWTNRVLNPGVDYMYAYGYQTNGQPVHTTMGGGWQTNGSPRYAELADAATLEKTNRVPFDVRLEFVTDDGMREDVLIGDSISAASDADFPVRESPLATAGRMTGRHVRHHGFGGAAFGEWVGGSWIGADSMKWQDVTRYGPADRAFIMLGNNDVHADNSLSKMQSDFGKMVAALRERVSSNIVACTVTPRTAWAGTAKETVRQQFNDWLRSLPFGIVAVADTARAVEDEAGTGPRAEFVTADGIHFNTAGSNALAAAMTSVGVATDPTDWAAAIAAFDAAVA